MSEKNTNKSVFHFLCHMMAAFAALLATAGSGYASSPGWYSETAPLVSPVAAKSILAKAPATPTTAMAQAVPQQMAASSISDYTQLAEALENDPLRIYQFVRNNFEYVPYYGALKGPHLTLLERSGNDFDQAAVLVELLRAAGYTANYQHGTMDIPLSDPGGNDLSSWLGTEADNTVVGTLIATGGIPALNFGSSFTIDRLWVVLDINGTIHHLDPSFKPHNTTPGIDLASAMGHDRAQLLAAAGGTTGPDSISNLNQSALDSHLAGLASNLVTGLRQNHPNASVRDILGGSIIIPDTSGVLPAALPFAGSPTASPWTDIPATYVHTVNFQHGGIDQTLDIPSIAGRKVSITYAGSGTQIPPPPPGATDFGTVSSGDGPTFTWTNSNPNSVTVQLAATLSGDNAFSFVSGGGTHSLAPGGSLSTQVKFTAIGQTAGRKNATLTFIWSYNGSVFSTNQVDLTGVVDVTPVAEIHLDDALLVSEGTPSGNLTDFTISIDHPYAASGGTFADQTVTFTLNRNSGSYVLASAFGGDRNSLLLGERQRILDSMKLQGLADNSREVLTEALNIIGQGWMQQTELNNELLDALSNRRTLRHHRFGIAGQESGYFVDMKAQFSPDLPTTTTASTGAFQASSYISSAMEHSVLEQLQTPTNPGISTIKVFALNNQSGNKFFLANQSNYGSIQSQLTDYSANQLANFQNIVNNNGTLVLPENGQITLNSWTGNGYVDYRVNGSSRSMGMIISGGLNGGFCSIPAILDPALMQNQAYMQSIPPGTIPRNMAADPVDLNSGAFVTRMADISIAGDGPRGLAFTRHFNSRLVSKNTAGLGQGWTHSYNIHLAEHSDIRAGLGARTPVDAAALIVATFATRDLVENLQPTLQEWAVAALVANWATDQLLQKAVTVQVGDEALTFSELPDGSFAPPPGVTSDLVRLGDGTYQLQDRFGTLITFNTVNKISSLTDIEGNTLTFTYTGNLLTQVKDTYNRTLTLGYAGNQLVSVSDSNGRSVGYTQTGSDLTGVMGLENTAWTYTYDTLHRLKTVINPESVTIVDNNYDDSDRVIQQLAPRETGTATYRMHYTGLSSAEEDPLGNRTTYHYDFSGRTVAVEDATGNIARIQYDGQGQTTQLTDARGNTSTQAYDAFNNHIQTTNARLETTSFSYDTQHRLERVTDALGHFSEIDYDSSHRPVATRDGEDNQATTSYLASGLIGTQTDARLVTTTHTYDVHGYQATAKSGNQPVITTVHDAIGRMASATNQAGTPTLFTYDDRGLVTEVTDVFNKKTFSSYDNLGRLSSQTDRNGDTVTTAYTPSGKLDVLSHTGHSVSFDYDPRDNLVSMTDPLGTTTNIYDAHNRLTGHTDPNGFTVNYAYDKAGNLTQLTYPGNKTVSYTYDQLNRIDSISIDWLGVSASASYDTANRLTGISHFNGTGTSYRYDNADRLVGITHQSGAQVLADYTYTLDPNGNRIQAVISNEPILPVSTPDETRGQTYNATKNRLTQSSTAAGTTNFSFDNEGQLLTKGTTSFTFDSAHRLTGYAGNNYQYDGVGNRLVATRNGTTTKYIYDASGNLLSEADVTNSIKRYYIYGIGLMAMVDAQNGELFVYHYNGTGHTVAMTDSSKAVANKYAYDPYGRLVDQQEASTQPFTFTGQFGVQREPDGLYYMRARYYDQGTGRFISEDPIGMIGGLNLYAYAGGNPVTLVDPSGEWAWVAAGALVGGVINLGATYIANDGNITFNQGFAAFAGGAVAGAIGSIAGPAGGTIAMGLGATARGATAIAAAGVVSGGGGYAGQVVANSIDPAHQSDPLNAALWAAGGGALAKAMPTNTLNSLAQAKHFGAKTLGGLFGSTNSGWYWGSTLTSSALGTGTNFFGK